MRVPKKTILSRTVPQKRITLNGGVAEDNTLNVSAPKDNSAMAVPQKTTHIQWQCPRRQSTFNGVEIT
jgi:hypothetical protein